MSFSLVIPLMTRTRPATMAGHPVRGCSGRDGSGGGTVGMVTSVSTVYPPHPRLSTNGYRIFVRSCRG